MHEIVVNLHMHTCYSDGTGTHKDIAEAAIITGLDAVIVTDHNVLVQGVEGYYHVGRSRVLLLVGQEVHDQDRDPQKNHLLVFNANRDLSTLADDPQTLINGVAEAGG
jgi:predicted metal-dependent phosphoesterase TrpH